MGTGVAESAVGAGVAVNANNVSKVGKTRVESTTVGVDAWGVNNDLGEQAHSSAQNVNAMERMMRYGLGSIFRSLVTPMQLVTLTPVGAANGSHQLRGG